MIQRIEQGSKKAYDSLFAALRMKETIQEVVSVTGGGGKTTLIRRLQQEYMQRGIPHAVSTTTHMHYVRNVAFLEKEDLERLLAVEKKEHTVWMGKPVSEIKMKGFSSDFLETVKETGLWLLLEADGAKGLPVKAPAEHEPVIPPFSTRVIQVYGLDGIGHSIGEKCFRPQYVADILGKTTRDLLTPVDIARLAISPRGGRKSVDAEMRYQVVLNKADDEKRQQLAVQIADELAECGITDVVMTSGLYEPWRNI